MFDFLSLKTEAFGLNINDSSVKIAWLKKRGSSFSLDFYSRISIKEKVVENGEIKDVDFLAGKIKEAIKDAKGAPKYVVASLPEEKSFLQVIQMPKMSPAELQSAVLFESANYIPMPLDQVYFDFQPIEQGSSRDHLDILISAIPKKIADDYGECIKKAGFLPIIFEIESQSLARALVKNQQSYFQTAIVDMGEDAVCFTAFAGQSVRFTCTIPISLMELKLAGGNFKNLAGQIEKYLTYYLDHASHEHLPETSAGKIKMLISGEGSYMPGMQEFLSKYFNMEVKKADPFANIKLKNRDDAFLKKSLSFAPALGLALRAATNND